MSVCLSACMYVWLYVWLYACIVWLYVVSLHATHSMTTLTSNVWAKDQFTTTTCSHNNRHCTVSEQSLKLHRGLVGVECLANVFGMVKQKRCWLKVLSIHFTEPVDLVQQVLSTIGIHKPEWTCKQGERQRKKREGGDRPGYVNSSIAWLPSTTGVWAQNVSYITAMVYLLLPKVGTLRNLKGSYQCNWPITNKDGMLTLSHSQITMKPFLNTCLDPFL